MMKYNDNPLMVEVGEMSIQRAPILRIDGILICKRDFSLIDHKFDFKLIYLVQFVASILWV